MNSRQSQEEKFKKRKKELQTITKRDKKIKKREKFQNDLKWSKIWEISFFSSLFFLLIFVWILIVFFIFIPYFKITISPESY